MAKNEAKIRFTAETGDFNNQIKQSNAEMSKLRAEMKLNDEQMKTAGTSVEGLQQKQKLLQDQLTASQAKTEALSQKVQKAAEIYGENSAEVTKLQTQLLTAQTAEERLQRQLNTCNQELENQVAATNRVETETEKLSGTISDQQKELNQLKSEYTEAVLKFGATSDEANELAGKIDTLSGELKDNKQKMNDASSAADELDKSLDDASDNNGEGFTVFKGALADLISNGIQSAMGAINEFVGYLSGLPEATMEIRQDFATLTTAFDNVGFSSQTATETWKGLYAVFGEDDRAIETANHIAKIAQNEEDLNKWVEITTGIWGTYQDSLPVEGLAEAANETIKVGQVTGGLADALNWSSEAAVMFADYMSEDVVTAEDAFNEALKECNTEQERQQLITDTLTTLYGGAAETYRETSGAMYEAKEATAQNILVENQLASTMEPLTTRMQELKTELLQGISPALEAVTGFMMEHPKLMTVLATTIGILAGAVSALAIGFGIYTAAQWLATSALWAFLAPLLPIVLAITAVVAAIVACIVYWDEIKAAVISAASAIWEAIKSAWDWIVDLFSSVGSWFNDNVIKPVADFFTGLWQGIVDGVVGAWNWLVELFSTVGQWIYDNVIAPVLNFFVGLWQGIVNAFHTVIDPWIEIIKRASALIYETVIQPIAQFFVDLWNSITSGLKAAWDWCVNIAMTVAGWVNEKVVQPVVNFFVGLWNSIKSGVQTAVDTFKNIFATVSGWVNEKVIQPVTNFFKGLWEGFKNGATNAWNGIKSIFSNVANFFGDIFRNAWEKVKQVFSVGGKIFSGIKDGIVNAFKSVVNVIIKGLNKVISVPLNGLNKVLNKISGISILDIKPFSWLTWRAPVPQIPLLAKGGILTRPTLNIAGEAGPEAIIPLDKLKSFIGNAVKTEMKKGIKTTPLNIDTTGLKTTKEIKDALSNYEIYNKTTLAQQAEYWDNARQMFEEGTQDRIDADKEYFSAKENLNKKILDAENNLYNELQTIYDKVDERTEQLFNSFGLLEQVDKTSIFDTGFAQQAYSMIDAQKSQIEALEEYRTIMQSLGYKIKGTALWSNIKELGVEDLDTLKAVHQMSDIQLQEYVSLFEQKTALAKDIAQSELKYSNEVESNNALGTFTNTLKEAGVVVSSILKEIKINNDAYFGIGNAIPKFAKGGILTKPTLNIAGEAGPEAIVPIDKLQSYISGAIDKTMQVINLQSLVYAIEDLANRAIELNINGYKFATATASDADIVNGSRMQLSKRGLAR